MPLIIICNAFSFQSLFADWPHDRFFLIQCFELDIRTSFIPEQQQHSNANAHNINTSIHVGTHIRKYTCTRAKATLVDAEEKTATVSIKSNRFAYLQFLTTTTTMVLLMMVGMGMSIFLSFSQRATANHCQHHCERKRVYLCFFFYSSLRLYGAAGAGCVFVCPLRIYKILVSSSKRTSVQVYCVPYIEPDYTPILYAYVPWCVQLVNGGECTHDFRF